jgi:hypothetical protein
MKRLLWIISMLPVLISGSAYASGVGCSTIFLAPNDGTGGNFACVQPNVGVFGGLDGSFYNDGPYAPGSTLGGVGADLFVDGGYLQRGHQSYDLVALAIGVLDLSSFTFPTNGKSFFTVPVTIDFSVPMMILETGEQIDVSGAARGTMSFSLFDDGFYYASGGFNQAPEPSTLGLVGIGLIGVLASMRKRLSM